MGVFDFSVVAAAFSAGVFSFFAPCAFPLLPGYVGYYVASVDSDVSLGGAVARGGAAGAGAAVVFAGIALVVVTIGRSVLNQLKYLEPMVGLLLIALGILLAIDRMPTLHVQLPGRRASVLGFGLFGAGYAIAAAGCFAPVFVAVLLEAMTLSAAGSAITIGAFAFGMAGLLLAATVAIAIGHDVGAGTIPRYTDRVKPVAGLVIVAAGLYQLHEAAILLGWL
jgi:cytochrome c-type biogenesis protein